MVPRVASVLVVAAVAAAVPAVVVVVPAVAVLYVPKLFPCLNPRKAQDGQEATEAPASETPLADTTNEKDTASKAGETRAARPQKQRGPPEDGIPSKTKVMVANLPYDLTEDKVGYIYLSSVSSPPGVTLTDIHSTL